MQTTSASTDQIDALERRLRRWVRDEQFRPGERIGSERGLAETLGIPRSMLRAALSQLENDRVVYRAMGRAGGVFAADGKIDRNPNTIEGVPSILRQQGFSCTTTVLRAEVAVAGPAERRNLALAADEPVFRLTRRRDADGSPLSLDRMSLPARRFPDLHRFDFRTSVYAILTEHYGLEISHANETIDVTPAGREHAEILGITEGAPLVDIWRTTYTADGTPIEFAHDLFRSDRTRVTVRRYGARWKRVADTDHPTLLSSKEATS